MAGSNIDLKVVLNTYQISTVPCKSLVKITFIDI